MVSPVWPFNSIGLTLFGRLHILAAIVYGKWPSALDGDHYTHRRQYILLKANSFSVSMRIQMQVAYHHHGDSLEAIHNDPPDKKLAGKSPIFNPDKCIPDHILSEGFLNAQP